MQFYTLTKENLKPKKRKELSHIDQQHSSSKTQTTAGTQQYLKYAITFAPPIQLILKNNSDKKELVSFS